MRTKELLVCKTAKRSPQLEARDILRSYLALSAGREAKWFATARSLGLNDLALELARRGPCEPQTILTGAHDLAQEEPEIAFQMALAAVQGYLLGWAYEFSVCTTFSAPTDWLRNWP